MKAAGVAFLASTLTAGALTPVIREMARARGVLDHALTSRKLHGKPIPRLGGVAIVLAFYTPLIALYFVDSTVGQRFWAHAEQALGLIAGGLAIALLGVYDDLKGSGAKPKLLVQFAVASAMYAVGFRIDHITNPFGGSIELGWFGLPFTMVWIAGVINALNLIDGLDGLAGGVAFIALGTTFAVAALRGDGLMLLFVGALAGAVLGFLFYNFNPATIFMGDTGSMFLGFVLATTAIQTHQKSSAAVALAVPIIALGVPIADTLLAMARRAARGVPMFSADRGHIHHRLLDLGLSHRQTVLVIYAVSLGLGAVALAMTYATSAQAMGYVAGLLLLSYLALRRLGFFCVQKAQDVLQVRRRNMEVRASIRRVGNALRSAHTVDEMWVGVRMAAQVLGATCCALHLGGRDDVHGAYVQGFDDAGPDLFRARYSLLVERMGEDAVELGWTDGRTTVDRDTEIAIELLCEHLAMALERVAEPERPAELAKVIGFRR